MTKLVRYAVAVLLAVNAGCSMTTTVIPEPPAPMLDWTLGPQDEIEIQVYTGRTAEMTRLVTVGPSGKAMLPFVGEVQFEGLTLQETANLLSRRLEEFYKRPQVVVTAKNLRNLRYFLMGEVSAGAKPLLRPTTLMAALAENGGYRVDTAFVSDIRIIRGSLTNPTVIRVNGNQILNGEITDVPLTAGDIVYVPAHPITQWNRTMGQLLGPFTAVTGVATNVNTIQTTK